MTSLLITVIAIVLFGIVITAAIMYVDSDEITAAGMAPAAASSLMNVVEASQQFRAARGHYPLSINDLQSEFDVEASGLGDADFVISDGVVCLSMPYQAEANMMLEAASAKLEGSVVTDVCGSSGISGRRFLAFSLDGASPPTPMPFDGDPGGSDPDPTEPSFRDPNTIDTGDTQGQIEWIRSYANSLRDAVAVDGDLHGSISGYSEMSSIVVRNPPASNPGLWGSNAYTIAIQVPNKQFCDDLDRASGGSGDALYAESDGDPFTQFRAEGCGSQGTYWYWRRIDDAAFPKQKEWIDRWRNDLLAAAGNSWSIPNSTVISQAGFSPPAGMVGSPGIERRGDRMMVYAQVNRPVTCGMIDKADHGSQRNIADPGFWNTAPVNDAKGCGWNGSGYFTWIGLDGAYVQRFAQAVKNEGERIRLVHSAQGDAAARSLAQQIASEKPFLWTHGFWNVSGFKVYAAQLGQEWKLCQAIDDLGGNSRNVKTAPWNASVSTMGCANNGGNAWLWYRM